jgi:ParB-like chromosome segregation protein Spo0J
MTPEMRSPGRAAGARGEDHRRGGSLITADPTSPLRKKQASSQEEGASATAINLNPDKYQLLPTMAPEVFEALKADIAQRGVLVPIDVDEHGNILDGHHRYRAWAELQKNEPPPTIVRAGLSEDEKRVFARKANILRRHLTREQVRELIAEQLKDSPGWSDRRTAREFGVDHKTVAAVRGGLTATGEIPQFDRTIGADGKERPASNVRPGKAAPRTTAADQTAAIVESLRAAGGLDMSEVPTDLKLKLFDLGLGGNDVVVMRGSYDPYAGCSEAEIKQWYTFALFLVRRAKWQPENACDHCEWLVRRHYQTPAEWLGEDGAQYRRSHGMADLSPAVAEVWAAFAPAYSDKTLAEVQSELCEGGAP